MTRSSTPDPALAASLRCMREARGITREALAFRTGITVSALSRIELARTTPGWDTVRLLAGGLDVSLVELSAAVEGSRSNAERPPHPAPPQLECNAHTR